MKAHWRDPALGSGAAPPRLSPGQPRRAHRHAGYDRYLEAKHRMIRTFEEFFGAEVRFSGSLWYPPSSYRLWHTNETQPGWRMYVIDFDEPLADPAETSFFRYMDSRTERDRHAAASARGWSGSSRPSRIRPGCSGTASSTPPAPPLELRLRRPGRLDGPPSRGRPEGRGSVRPPAARPRRPPAGPAPRLPAIRRVGVRKSYPGVDAVRGIDLTVAQGETFGFLGPNGAGKTTTIAMLCTLAVPTAGRIEIAGHDTRTAPGRVRRNLGIVFQETHPRRRPDRRGEPPLPRRPVLPAPGDAAGARRRDAGPGRAADRRDALVRTFSGGMQPSAGDRPRPASPAPRCCSWTSRPSAWIRRPALGSGLIWTRSASARRPRCS